MRKNKLRLILLLIVITLVAVSGYESSVKPRDDSSNAPSNNTQETTTLYDLSLSHPVENICLKNVPSGWGKVIATSVHDNSGYGKGGTWSGAPSITITFENGHSLNIWGFTTTEKLRAPKFEVNIDSNCNK